MRAVLVETGTRNKKREKICAKKDFFDPFVDFRFAVGDQALVIGRPDPLHNQVVDGVDNDSERERNTD